MKSIALYAGLAALAGLGIFALVLLLRTPSHDRDWISGHERLPRVGFDGDVVTVRGVRDFRYEAGGAVAEARYEDRTYDLTTLDSVWYGISQISGFKGIAHTFLSFGFSDGRYLAMSIEARREVGEGYGPIRGLFRNYEVIYVLGDERDVIGLRSHVQRLPVRLYRIAVTPEEGTWLLRALLDEADAINRSPRFYNTLIDNCTTGIAKYATPMPAWRRLLDYRIVLPGYSDRLVRDLGLLGPGDTGDRALIDPGRGTPESETFSRDIRAEFLPSWP